MLYHLPVRIFILFPRTTIHPSCKKAPFYYPCLVPMKKDLQCEVWQISLSSYIYLIVNAITYPLWVSISNRY